MKRINNPVLWLLLIFPFILCPEVVASTSKQAQADLSGLLLGKDVKALLDMPAYKDGLDLYLSPKENKHLDDRGIDLKELSNI